MTTVGGGCDREYVEDDSLLNQQGCGALYAALEDCLGEHERDWTKCQPEVKAFGRCYASFKKKTPAASPAANAGTSGM
jgi:hypothetical protein